MLLLQAPTAELGCEAGALQENTEAASREAAAHKATSVDSCPDVPLGPEVAWTEERLSEDDASRGSVHPATDSVTRAMQWRRNEQERTWGSSGAGSVFSSA